MSFRVPFLFLLGAMLVVGIAFVSARRPADVLAGRLARDAAVAIRENGGSSVVADFRNRAGWAVRHPTLRGGTALPDDVRARTARAVTEVAGVGGVRWQDASALVRQSEQAPAPMHCQDDVDALLGARSIRFEESSAAIQEGSQPLVNEVAQALRPCLGSIIAITGHTDSSGPEAANLALSRDRATAVRDALVRRGIPQDGLRARGLGSRAPIEGLDPTDPANRRIEFSVVATVPLKPTPVDTPGAH